MLPESIFAKKRFLITDDMVDMRSAIKRMVEAIGAQPQNIEIGTSGEEAIVFLSKNKYDIVLCDYSLGEGKDGQQVLEEARYRGILPHSCIFMLLTAESTAEMVMGALEYEPDGYLVKPFTKDMFHQRLEKVIQKKVRLGQIYKALDEKNPDKALLACDKYLSENPSGGTLACKKLKASILLDLNKIEEAKQLYTEVLAEKDVPWAQHGLAKVYFYQQQFDKAIELLEKMIAQSQLCLEAYDWLARVCMKVQQFERAEQALQTAVRLSPKAILRQQALGQASKYTKNVEITEKAYRQAIKLGRYSCYQQLSDHYDLTEALVRKTFSDSGMASKRAGNEAVTLMDELLKMNRSDKVITLQATVLKAAALSGLTREPEAKATLAQADKQMEGLNSGLAADVYLRLARIFAIQGAKERAYKCLAEAVKRYPNQSGLRKEANALIASVGLGAALEAGSDLNSPVEDAQVDEVNRKSSQLFEQGQIREALSLLQSTAQELDRHLGAQLNAISFMLKFMEKYGKEPLCLNAAQQLLALAKALPKDPKRQSRLEELEKNLGAIS